MFEDQDPVESFSDFVSRTSPSAPAKRKPAPATPAPGSFGEFVQQSSKPQREPDGPEVPAWALRQSRTIDVVPDALDFRGPTEGDKLVDRAMTAAGAVAPPPTEARIGRSAFARRVRPERSAAAVASDDAAAQSFERSNTPIWTDNEPLTTDERRQASEGFLASLALDKQAQEQQAKAAVEAEAKRAPKDAFSRVGGNFARGVVSGAGQPIEMMATDDRHPVLKEAAAKALADIEDVAREYFPLDRRDPAKLNPFKGDFYSVDNAGKILTESIPYAAGTTVPFAAISAGAGGAASLLAPEAAAAEVIPRMTVADAVPAWAARRLPARLAARELTEGVTGADLVGRASASATGASSTAAQEYEAAKRAGMTDEQAARSAAIGAVIGMSEGLGAPSTVGKFRRGAHIIDETVEEALQEGFSQAATGVNAKYLTGYDPNKPVSEIAGEAAGNALVGGAVGGLMATPGGISKPHTAPGPQAQIRPQIDERSRLNEAALAQAATSPAAPTAPPNQGGTQAGPQPSAPSRPAAGVLFPQAQAQPAIEDLSSLSPTDRVNKLLERTNQMREGRAQANVEQQLNKDFAEASGLLDAAEQGWDVDRPTAELYVQSGAKKLKSALSTLQSSPGFQAELQAAAAGQPLPATPYTTAVQTIQARLANAEALVNRDADIARIEKEGRSEVDRIQAEIQAEADQAQKEQAKLQRKDEKEQAKFERKAQKEDEKASRLDARRRLQEENKKARQAEMELQRRTAQDERSRRIAEAELQRISAHNAALQQADKAGQRSLQYHNEGRTSEAIAELIVQQNQLRDAVKYLPRTSDAQAVKADLNRYSGQIGNRIGDLRRQMRGGRGGRGETTEPIPSLLSPDAIVNPDGGVPKMLKAYEEAHYQPGSSFQRLAEEQADETEETTPLLTAIRRLGGIRDDGITGGELRRLGVKESGTTGLVNRNGSAPDRMREMLAGEGYLPDDSTVSDLFDAIEAEMRGADRDEEGESFDDYYRRQAEEEREAQRRGDGATRGDSFEEYLARQDRQAEIEPAEERADDEPAGDSFGGFIAGQAENPTDEEAEDLAAYERAIKRSLAENPRPYGERTRPPEPGSSGLSFSGFNVMLARHREEIDRLRTMDLNSPEAREIISEIEADNARIGLEDNRGHLTPHLEELITMIMSDQFEALAEEEESLLDQIGDEIHRYHEEDAPAIEGEIAALDLVFEDEDMRELLEVAAAGDDNAASQFIDYGTQFYGITEQTATDLIETRRAARTAQRADLARHDAPRPAQQAPRTPEKLTDREVRLLRTNPSDVFDEQFDSYMQAVEDLHARAVRGEVDVDPTSIYDPVRWVGVPSDVVSRLIENKSAPRAPLLNRIHGNRSARVDKGRLPARENVEIINKYKNADLLSLAKPTRANRMSRLTQLINAAKTTVEKNPSGAAKVWMDEVRDLLQRALAARAQYEAENPSKAPGVKTVPGVVAHPDPKLDGKPVLARTSDGRVVVENSDNKGGISVVKDRSESPEAQEADDDRIVRERAEAALKLAKESPAPEAWEFTREEFEALPKAYRGIRENSATEGLLFVTPQLALAKQHGKRVMEGRIVDLERLVPDPEVEGFEARDLTGRESFELGSASTTIDNFPPDRHEMLVRAAVRDGKPVPSRVLADYSDLARPATKASTEPKEFEPLAGPTDPAVIKNRKREIGKLMPFNIQGNKSDLLAKGLGALMERAAKGTRRMIDAFAGSGTYTHYMRSRKIANQGDILNEFEPLRYIAHKQLRDNPEAVAAEADRVVADLRKLTAPIREGEPFSDTHDRIRQQVAAYFQGRLRALVVEGENLNERGRTGEPVEMVDSPETAGVYLVLQNQSLNFLPVQAEVSAPTVSENQSAFNFYEEDAAAREPKFRLPGFGVISNESGKVGLFAHGRERILQSGVRALEAGRRMVGVDVRRGDGWALIGREAKAGDLVPVDTSYLNRGSQETSNYNKATAEDAVPAIYNEKVRKNLLPAWDRGAKLVITNNWDEGVASFLRSLGFRLVKAFRQGASKDDIQSGGAAELIAVNFDPATGEFFERRRDDAPGVAADVTGQSTLDRRSADGGQAGSERLAEQPEGEDATVRGRRSDSGDGRQLTEEPKWVTEARARAAGGRPQLPDQVDVVGYEAYRPGITRPEWTQAVVEKLGSGAQRFTEATWQRLQPPRPKIHRRAEEAPVFYSQLERTIESKMPAKASAEQVRAIIENPQNGVKSDEVKWSGLDDFLRDKRSVTKQEVSDFLKANRVEVKEITRGGLEYDNTEEGLEALAAEAAQDDSLWDLLNTRREWDSFDSVEARMDYLFMEDPEALSAYINRGERAAATTRYSEYALPGAKPGSYRELLLTLPIGEDKTLRRFRIYDEDGNLEMPTYYNSEEEARDDWQAITGSDLEEGHLVVREESPVKIPADRFMHSHWDEPNVLAHVRYNERTDAKGKRVLFLEEIQSDWHQKGRRSGYKPSPEEARQQRAAWTEETDKLEQKLGEKTGQMIQIEKEIQRTRKANKEAFPQHTIKDRDGGILYQGNDGKAAFLTLKENERDSGAWEDYDAVPKLPQSFHDLTSEWQRLGNETDGIRARIEEINSNRKLLSTAELGGPPKAPFSKTWHEFAFKRMLRYAAENGYDRIAWATGEQQAERYDLSKQVSEVGYVQGRNGRFTIYAKPVTGGNVSEVAKGIEAEKLSDYVGKELAEKMIAGEGAPNRSGDSIKIFRGVDLKIGGEGLKGFYDRILPAFANKYAKKWGAKVQEVNLGRLPKAENLQVFEGNHGGFVVARDEEGLGALPGVYKTRAEAEAEILRLQREDKRQGFGFNLVFDDHGPYHGQVLRDENNAPVFFPSAMEAEQHMQDEGLPQMTVTPASKAVAHGVDVTPEMRASVMKGQPLFRKEPVFYSQLERTINAKMPAKASAAQIRAIIENPQSGVKPDEVKWTGLDDFLGTKESFTKQEVLDHLAENRVELKEVMKSDSTQASSMQRELNSLASLGAYRSPEQEREYNSLARRLQRLQEDGGGAKYAQHSLGGYDPGTYRELLLTLPPRPSVQKFEPYQDPSGRWWAYNVAREVLEYAVGPDGRSGFPTRAGAEEHARELRAKPDPTPGSTYTSSHYSEPNILAHVRFDERSDADGKRVLFVQEIQSDWHQAGRKGGYREKWPKEKVDKFTVRPTPSDAGYWMVLDGDGNIVGSPPVRFNKTAEAALALIKKSALDGTLNGMGKVPDAPFKKTWHELAFKRVLRFAAENGFDKIAWTTGEQQADRYDLSKQVDMVRAAKDGEGTYVLFAFKGGVTVFSEHKVPADRVADYLGKDLAERILAEAGEVNPRQTNWDGYAEYSGVDLKVGGQGMKGFYDKILPSFASKYGKKWGAKVGVTEISSRTPDPMHTRSIRREGTNILATQNDGHEHIPLGHRYNTEAEAEAALQAWQERMDKTRQAESARVHSMDITPEMRASVEEGQPLFRKEPTFYSQLERTITAKMPAKASAAQVRAILSNPQNGVKADELKWTGLDNLLERGGHFTKEQVLDHLRQNRVQFDEVVKGARPGVERRLPPDQIVRRLNEEDADIFGEPVGSWGLFSLIDRSDEDDLIVPLGNWPTYEHAVDAAFASAEEAGIDYEEHMGAVSNTDAKFSHYTLPGEKADYTELLLTLPVEDRSVRELPADYRVEQPRRGGDGWTVYDPQGRDYGYGSTREQAIEDALRLLNDLAEPSEGVYNSSHYGEPNILAHVRFDTRTDADGKRILFLEEVQSDWHQEGRKRGYKPNSRELAALDKELEQALSAYNQAFARWREATGGRNVAVFDSTSEGAEMLGRLRELQQSRYPSGNAVPDAPFKKTWHELVFKRMLRHAAENGFDRVGWTTGAQQADRYDLAKQVSEIRVYKRYNGDGFNVNARGLNGEMVVMQHAKTADDLADLIGKDAAQKALDIIESGNRLPTGEQAAFLRGDDLKVGGSGMRGFYDKILPAFASKYAKKWGAKVGETNLADAYGQDDATIPRDQVVNHPAFIRDRGQGLSYDDAYMNAEGEIFQERAAQQGLNKIHFIDVTPAMRESVLEGQPLFQKPSAQGLPGLTEADLPQIIADARVTFKSGKRGASGTVYANDSAAHILRAAFKEVYGEDADLLNFNTESSVIQAMAEVIEKDAGDAYFQAKTRKQLRSIARELQAAADAADTVSVIFADKGRGFSDIAKSRRHELTHAAQSGLQNSRGFLQGHRFGRVIADRLAEMGYAPEDRTMEAAAFVAGGEWQRVGLTEQQGREFLHDYFDDIARTNGREALERFVTLAPKIKSALAEVKERYGTQRQNPAGSESGKSAQGDRGADEPRQSGSGGSKVSRRVEPGVQGQGRADGEDSSDRKREVSAGRGFSVGPLENEPTGPIAASGLGVLQQVAAGKNPRTTPLREIVADHRPIQVDPLKIQDQALEAIVKAGVARTLPGARALYWADKLKARGLTNRLANRQAKFIEDAIAKTNAIIEASERMARADRTGAEYQKARKELQQLRRELHAQLAKLSDYSGPVEYAAKYSKAALLTAAHILTNNILDQVASFPLHEAQKMLGFMLPVKALQKWGVDVDRTSVDFRDLVPAIAREFGAVLRGTKDALPDIYQMLRYGTTDLLLDEEVARQQADDLDEEGKPRTGGADRYELGKRARGVPGLDQTIAAIGRMHGAADAFGRRWALTTALTAQANAIAKKVGKEHGLSTKEIKDLAVDLAAEPSPQMMVLAADEANRFILDFPTFIHNAIQTLRKVGSNDPKYKLASLAFNRALDFVVKFEKIPLAAQMQSLVHYSPVGLIGQGYNVRQASLSKKAGKPISKAESAEIAERLRQGLLGTLMWAGVGVLGSLGYLQFTGGGDDRNRVRNAEGALGENPFEPELVVGDTAIGISKLGVAGRAGSLAARVASAARRRTDPLTGEQEPVSKVATRSAKAAAEGLINDNPVGRGVGEIIGPALSGQFGEFGQKFVRGQVRSFVPGILRDLAKLQDPTARIPDDTSFSSQLEGDFRSGNPWTRGTLQPRLDAMGRPIKEANPFLPYRPIEDVPRRRELEEMRRLGTGPSSVKREKGTSAPDFNKEVTSRASQTKAALDRITPGQAVRSDAARARVYASELTGAAMKRADKLSPESVQTEYDIEALRADAYAALRELPAYQSLNDRQKEAARKRVDERLKSGRARAASSRAGEKPAALPGSSARDLAREAITSR